MNVSRVEFGNLINYYIECLKEEDYRNLRFNLHEEGKKFFPENITEESLFQRGHEEFSVNPSEKLSSTIKTNSIRVFYGYPVYVDKGEIAPLFFVEILVNEKDGKMTFVRQNTGMELNRYVLVKNKFSSEIDGIAADIDEERSFDTKLRKICTLLGSDFKASRLLSKDNVRYQETPKIINKAIIYSGVNTGYTRSLIKELDVLKGRSHQSTALHHILNPSETKKRSFVKSPDIEILEMNDSQENAVEESLSNLVTVITGPPGTGKSWVVKNLIANAVFSNQTVLLASKNNKAVDVVVNDLKSVFGMDFIVRMGHREKRRNAFSEIESIIATRRSLKVPNIKKLTEELKAVNSSIIEIKNEKMASMKKIMDLQNELETYQSKIDSSLDIIPEKLREIYTDKYGNFNHNLLEKDLEFFRDCDGILKKIIRILLPWYYKSFVCKNFRNQKGKISKKILRYINDFWDSDERLEKFIRLMESYFKVLDKLTDLMKKREDIFNEIQKIDSEDIFDVKIHDMKKRKIEISKAIVKGTIIEKIKTLSESDINHITRYIDITKKLEEGFIDRDIWKNLSSEWEKEIVHALKTLPVWVVTNLSAKNSFPLSGAFFDLLIIDESSQNDIASTLPLLYRAKRTVIIGDPKQLRHVCTMNYVEDTKIASKNKVKNFVDFSYSKNSIYDVSERVVRSCNQSPLLLNEHYRSHRDIIDYSNIHFYENKLKIKTRDRNIDEPRRIKWVNVSGTTKSFGSSINIEEAKVVLDTLIKYSKSKLRNKSFGIVTLFRSQADLIEEEIEKSDIRKIIDVTVGTAHTFQGDQRDIIIFSPGVSKGVSKRTMEWINDSTPELINVAVTRARSLLVIVGDIDKCREYDGPLKKLADYAEENENKLRFDSPAEETLFNGLEKIGIFVKPQYNLKVGSKFYRLDFALFKDTSNYDIEVDGDTVHLERKEQDSLRNNHIRGLGWKIRRYRAARINDDMNDVLEEIKRLC
ncbi:MAG: AAA family ATPase [Candidatus Aenigmarchaeota archaeon]|nr:AAA family ATPase [Candidatus Aenigmarchaeota archaeon]